MISPKITNQERHNMSRDYLVNLTTSIVKLTNQKL